jgi:hypothetical protein
VLGSDGITFLPRLVEVELPLTGPVVQTKPPLAFVNGHTAPGPIACQFGGNVACVLPLFGCCVGGFSQSVQSIQL